MNLPQHLSGVLALLAKGELNDAEDELGRLIQANGEFAEGHHLQGIIHLRRNAVELGIAEIKRAIAIDPRVPAYFNNLGIALQSSGRSKEALPYLEEAVRLGPQSWENMMNLAEAYRLINRLDDAIRLLEDARRLNPNAEEVAFRLGKCLYAKREYAAAGGLFQTTLALNSDRRDALLGLAWVFINTGQYDEAELCSRTAMIRWPDDADTHSVLFNILFRRGNLIAAEQASETALARFPNDPDIRFDVGYIQYLKGEYERALHEFKQAEALGAQPCFVQSIRGWIHLLHGDFSQGLADYEVRFDCKFSGTARREFPQPPWRGESLAGKTLFVWCEQGLGDTLQFIRFLPQVKERGARVILECPRRLRTLLRQVAGVDEILVAGDSVPKFDVHQSVVSLPFVLGTRLDTIPRKDAYVFADESLVAEWRQRLLPFPGKKIGIAWQGNEKYGLDRYRSVPLEYFAPLAEVPEITLFSLQKGAGEKQIAAAREKFRIHEFPGLDEKNGPMMDTAAILKNLDCFITTDCGLAHLAGALGVRTWVVLGHVPDWRWLLERDDSPWYPSMRLFRQQRGEGWSEVFTRVAQALRQLEV